MMHKINIKVNRWGSPTELYYEVIDGTLPDCQ